MAVKMSIDELITRVGELPPMPRVAQRSLELIRDPDSNMADLAKVLSMDEAMTSLVLRWANSAYYGLRYPVATVQQAVAYLGQRTLHSLILAASVAALLDRAVPGYNLERGELWKHALGVAAGARIIAQKFGQSVAEEAYHAGLLCDIGKLAMEILLRGIDTSTQEWQNNPFPELEATHFGVDHAELGAELGRRWRLPPPLIDAIANHHYPSRANEGALLASAVHVSDAVVMSLGIGIGRDGLQYSIDPVALEQVGWTEAKFPELAERIIPFIDETDKYLRLRNTAL